MHLVEKKKESMTIDRIERTRSKIFILINIIYTTFSSIEEIMHTLISSFK